MSELAMWMLVVNQIWRNGRWYLTMLLLGLVIGYALGGIKS